MGEAVPVIAQPSVMSLLLVMRFNETVLSTGTGFLVQGESGLLLITNRHNLTGRHQQTGQPIASHGGVPDQVTIWHNASNGIGNWRAITEPLYDDDCPRWREHPVLGSKLDVVALPLTDTTDIAFYPYDLVNTGPDIQVGPSDYLSVVGFPFGLTAGGVFPVWATGFMASEPEVDFNDLPIFLIDCRSRQGQSGSAVLAYRSGGMVAMASGGSAAFSGPVWKFLGIYSGRINPESDLGIVWKASAVAELVQSCPSPQL